MPSAAALWHRARSVRVLTTLAAFTIVSIALAGAGVAIVRTVRASLVDRLRVEIASTARVAAAQLAAGVQPEAVTIPIAPDRRAFLPPLVQVVDALSGEVVAATPVRIRVLREESSREGSTSFRAQLPGPPSADRPLTTLIGSPDWIVYRQPVSGAGRRWLLLAASPRSLVDRNVATLATGLKVGFPLLAALVGALTWLVVGRTLRPVEAIRSQVEEISSHTLDRRVPVPQTGDEIAHLAQTMNRMLDRLEASTRRQREFVSDASHELRSPIAAIRTELEVVLRERDGTRWPEAAANVLAENERLERLVDDLLTLARLDEGRAGQVEDVDLDEVVLEETKRTRAVPVRVEEVTPVRVRGNREQLARLLRNLLDNAERYANEEVRVELRATDGVAHLIVADDGPGIAPEHRERVFERFTRLDDSRSRAGGGVGLGLALVQQIARQHRGSAEVLDAVEAGARLQVKLPLPEQR